MGILSHLFCIDINRGVRNYQATPCLLYTSPLLAADPAAFSARYLSGGFVFYGGLFGALAAVWLFCRRRKVPFSQLGADLVPAVPLFHTFGRVGCFLAGCCYGIPAPAGWPGVTFRDVYKRQGNPYGAAGFLGGGLQLLAAV